MILPLEFGVRGTRSSKQHTIGRLAFLALKLILARRLSSPSHVQTVSAIFLGFLLKAPNPPSMTNGTLPACKTKYMSQVE